MSDKEYSLRKRDIEAKAAYPVTYQPIQLKGQITLSPDAEITVNVPTQPFQEATIPDGQRVQADLVKNVATTAALTGAAAIAVTKANGDSKTVNNYNTGE